MSILAWLVLGLIAGFIASKLYAGSGQGVILDIVLGIVGAFVGKRTCRPTSTPPCWMRASGC